MPKATTITCDECGADLTTTSNCEGYRLALVNERIPPQVGTTTEERSAGMPSDDEWRDYESIPSMAPFPGIM